MAEEEGGGRPKRKNKGGRVIYRECDSDDEDYETFALIRYLDRALLGGEPKAHPRTNHGYIYSYKSAWWVFIGKEKLSSGFWVGGNFVWF